MSSHNLRWEPCLKEFWRVYRMANHYGLVLGSLFCRYSNRPAERNCKCAVIGVGCFHMVIVLGHHLYTNRKHLFNITLRPVKPEPCCCTVCSAIVCIGVGNLATWPTRRLLDELSDLIQRIEADLKLAPFTIWGMPHNSELLEFVFNVPNRLSCEMR